MKKEDVKTNDLSGKAKMSEYKFGVNTEFFSEIRCKISAEKNDKVSERKRNGNSSPSVKRNKTSIGQCVRYRQQEREAK